MNTKQIIMAMCTIVLMLTGCQKDMVKAPPPGQADLLLHPHYPEIVASEGLYGALRFTQPIVEPSTPTRPMRVTVPVRSIEDKYPLNLQYRFEFYDASGRSLDSTDRWAFINLPQRVQKQLDGNALSTQAVSWRLTIRPAR